MFCETVLQSKRFYHKIFCIVSRCAAVFGNGGSLPYRLYCIAVRNRFVADERLKRALMAKSKMRETTLFLLGSALFAAVLSINLVLCHLYWNHDLAHSILDSLVILVAPMFYAAFFYERWVYISTSAIAATVSALTIAHFNTDLFWSYTVLVFVLVFSGVICELIYRAIRQRDQAQEALRRSEERILHLQKMEALGQLTAGISHNFNNILTGVIGNLNLAQRKAEGAIKKQIEAALKSSRRAAKLTHELVLFSRKGEPTRKLVSINAIVADVGEVCESTFAQKTELTIDTPKDVQWIMGDPGQIYQAILNLCINARDAVETMQDRVENPCIGIAVKPIEVLPQTSKLYPGVNPGMFVCVSVSDNGPGMDEEIRRHIFEPFFTTKPVGKGTGLGLATVYGIIQRHHGFVECDTQPAKGTTFRLCLPCVEDVLAVADGGQALLSNGIPHGTETILLVDDEEKIRETTGEILQEHGYKVLLASDGNEGVKLYQAHRQEIELILMDLSMPVMTGQDALKEIHRIAPDAKAIAFTGYPVDLSTLDDVCTIIEKPFELEKLLQTVRTILDQSD